MNAKDALVQIKNLLFSEAEKKATFAMVEGKLVDGTMVSYDLETSEIYVIGEDGEAPSVEIEIEASSDVVEEPKKDEAMAKFEEVLGGLEKKVEELTAKVKAMEDKAEDVKEAVKMSAVILESLAKEPSDKAITAPNQFAKQLKKESNDRFNNLQKAFSTLKK